MRTKKIEVVGYQVRWPEEFATLALALVEGLGGLALAVDHIGSTAVQGLAAKDVIDIQISVADLDCPDLISIISALGYDHRPGLRDNFVGLADDSPELNKLYFCELPGEREVHIHVRQLGRLNQQYSLLFRDYLRADLVVRAAYQRVKQTLAVRFAHDPEAYYAIKDPYMDTIYRAALLWQVNSRSLEQLH